MSVTYCLANLNARTFVPTTKSTMLAQRKEKIAAINKPSKSGVKICKAVKEKLGHAHRIMVRLATHCQRQH
jgi:hypothetical protein